MSIEPNWSALAPYLLVGGGLAIALGGKGLKQFASAVVAKAKAVKPQQPSSDAEPPDGFKAHVAIILKACPNAPYETRLAYLMDGLTEAQTLRREVERLNATDNLNEVAS